ncbi:MAG: DUF3810 domain-containing protein [Prevotellaceae bacterium]|jgi:hypothetical protein|nr:DUF3810 domain-containing protein [Prevotellaceae bacterium]
MRWLSRFSRRKKVEILFSILRFILPCAMLFFVFLCSQLPGLAEKYIQNCYPAIATLLSFASCSVPFSLFDVLIIAAITGFVISIVLIFMRKISFFRWIKAVLSSVLWIFSWFYMAWGIAYFRPGFHERFEVEQPVADTVYFEALVFRYIDSLNKSYISEPYFDVNEIDKAIEAGYRKFSKQLRIPYPCGKRRAKSTVIEGLMTKSGVSGFFNPFFNEELLNFFQLPVGFPFSLAHEKAHQFGIASESECNLYAAIVCCSSDYPLVRYSGYLETVWYLLKNLRKISQEKYREAIKKINPHIIDDYNEIGAHWQKALNQTISAAQSKVYDSYLKTNKQQSGILSYSEMTILLVTWEKIVRNFDEEIEK